VTAPSYQCLPPVKKEKKKPAALNFSSLTLQSDRRLSYCQGAKKEMIA